MAKSVDFGVANVATDAKLMEEVAKQALAYAAIANVLKEGQNAQMEKMMNMFSEVLKKLPGTQSNSTGQGNTKALVMEIANRTKNALIATCVMPNQWMNVGNLRPMQPPAQPIGDLPLNDAATPPPLTSSAECVGNERSLSSGNQVKWISLK